MKGIVFTEFLELVEDRFGLEVADQIIQEAELPNDGAYTTVGTYDHGELVRMVVRLSEITGVEAPALVATFGEYLFGRLSAAHPEFLDGVNSAFDLLRQVHNVIHVEVRKLYPKAELPDFQCEPLGDDSMAMHYRSPRGFADLAEGLIRGCASHFGETLEITRDDQSGGKGTDVRFHLERKAA